MKTKKVLLGMAALFVSMSALADNPLISAVMVQQRWPWSRLVDIDYVLTCDMEESKDITVSAYNGSEPLDVPEDSFSGDLYNVKRGDRRIVWDPTKTIYTNDMFLSAFRVELTARPAPLYMIVDLTKAVGEEGQTEYVYEVDLTNGLWGAWVRNPVTNEGMVVESVIWTGVTTNDIYKTDKIVLRRIPAGAFMMGSSIAVSFSQTFYAGVYQVTQAQWEKLMGNNPAFYISPSKPVERVSYNDIRGATNSIPAINWPGTRARVHPSSFLGQLREKTGQTGFDLPTEAQWEYFCKAETTTYYNDGIDGSSTNQLNKLAWWEDNSGNETHPVGLKNPNAWGLYDTHGNVREWCLDWHNATLAGGVDPAGLATEKTYRVLRGGAFSQVPNLINSIYRWRDPPTYKEVNLGFRLVRNLQAH